MTAMPISKPEAPMSRMSIYISEPNRRRLAKVPRGQKTELVNKALEDALVSMEQRENFDSFMDEVKAIKRVRTAKSSTEMLKELRETGAR
jgi:hypothetical protein